MLASVRLSEHNLGDILEFLVVVKDIGDIQEPYEKEAGHAIDVEADMVEPCFSRKFTGFDSIVLISNSSEIREVEHGKVGRKFDVMKD